ncbi:MAG: hypothetical protein U5N55_13815 [Cypionkella sp.]|nr:hypothetical protein [Cypionkella sp.]
MIGNGLGPWWFPRSLRAGLTVWASARYPSLSWQMHDASYDAGSPARWICDRGFLRAMLTDALAAPRARTIFGLSFAAWAFWVAVRIGGHWSYNWDA